MKYLLLFLISTTLCAEERCFRINIPSAGYAYCKAIYIIDKKIIAAVDCKSETIDIKTVLNVEEYANVCKK